MSIANYLLWRIAAARYERRPWELDAGERRTVESQAAREHRVIIRALESPEAAAVEADAEVVQGAVAVLAQGYPDHAAFLQDLRRGGLSDAELRSAIGRELRAGVALERIGDAAVVEEQSVRAWYEQNRARLVTPERRVARHILITVGDTSPENSAGRARERMTELVASLSTGADFAELALRHSECPSALDGGKLGEVRRGQLYPELETALYALAPGESRVAESPLGLHLVRCDAVIPPQPLSYEAAAPAIRKRLESVAREHAMKSWLEAGEGPRRERPGAGMSR